MSRRVRSCLMVWAWVLVGALSEGYRTFSDAHVQSAAERQPSAQADRGKDASEETAQPADVQDKADANRQAGETHASTPGLPVAGGDETDDMEGEEIAPFVKFDAPMPCPNPNCKDTIIGQVGDQAIHSKNTGLDPLEMIFWEWDRSGDPANMKTTDQDVVPVKSSAGK